MAELKLAVGAVTDRGRVREANEDSLGTPPAGLDALTLARKGHLFVVADGMGGHVAGAAASQIAVRRIVQSYYADPDLDVPASLDRAIQAANQEIMAQAQDPTYSGMGTTAVAAVLRGHELTVANVGDSRAYLIRNGAIQQLTQDHSWVAEEVRAGALTPEEARVHPRRNVITRSLGSRPDLQVDYFYGAGLSWNGQPLTLRPGDVLVLCSDGLSNMVRDDEIRQLASSKAPQRGAQALVDLANQRGGPDNITVIVAQVQQVPGVPGTVAARAHVPALLPVAGGVLAFAAVVALVGVCALASLLGSLNSPPSTSVMAHPTPTTPPPSLTSPAPGTTAPGRPTSTVAPTVIKTTPSPSQTWPRETSPALSPTGRYRAPQLLEPADGRVFKGERETITLRWTDEGIKGTDVFYVVVIEYPHDGMMWRDEQWTKDTSLVVPTYLYAPEQLTGDRRCVWHVEIRRDTGERDEKGNKKGGQLLSQPGQQRSFVWEKEGEQPTFSPPTRTPPTDTPR